MTAGRPEVVDGERKGSLDQPVDLHGPRGLVGRRDVEVDHQVVHPRRRHVVAEPLEVHAVVAGGLPQLDPRDALELLGAHRPLPRSMSRAYPRTAVTRLDLPSGTVTFLFTDVEGSTKLLHALGDADYADALAEHRRVLRAAFSRHGGVEVDTQGDAFFVAFPSATGAVDAADDAVRALEPGPITVRIGSTREPAHDGRGLRRHRRPSGGSRRGRRPRRP